MAPTLYPANVKIKPNKTGDTIRDIMSNLLIIELILSNGNFSLLATTRHQSLVLATLVTNDDKSLKAPIRVQEKNNMIERTVSNGQIKMTSLSEGSSFVGSVFHQ